MHERASIGLPVLEDVPPLCEGLFAIRAARGCTHKAQTRVLPHPRLSTVLKSWSISAESMSMIFVEVISVIPPRSPDSRVH
jgi:hypothetical protein